MRLCGRCIWRGYLSSIAGMDVLVFNVVQNHCAQPLQSFFSARLSFGMASGWTSACLEVGSTSLLVLTVMLGLPL